MESKKIMHDINMNEPSEEFAKCWRAAGYHLQTQAGGRINSWLKANLTPPFLEHLSFRLGNQLFFIQIEDVDKQLDLPGSLDGLFYIADGCKSHACLLPMKKIGEEWRPMLPGWGLQDARTKTLINPVELITDEQIEITEWELHDFAVQIVRDQIKKEGKQIMSSQGNPAVDPSIWFVGDNGPEWVVVRSARYPQSTAARPINLAAIASACQKMSSRGNFASVACANSDIQHDSTATKVLRGHGLVVKYEGLEQI